MNLLICKHKQHAYIIKANIQQLWLLKVFARLTVQVWLSLSSTSRTITCLYWLPV